MRCGTPLAPIDPTTTRQGFCQNAHQPLLCIDIGGVRRPDILIQPTTQTVLGLDYSSPRLFVDSQSIPTSIVKPQNNSKELNVHNVFKLRGKIVNQP